MITPASGRRLCKFSAALETIVRSKPFREHRGLAETDAR